MRKYAMDVMKYTVRRESGVQKIRLGRKNSVGGVKNV